MLSFPCLLAVNIWIIKKINIIRVYITELIKKCPEETLCKYPFAMIVFGY